MVDMNAQFLCVYLLNVYIYIQIALFTLISREILCLAKSYKHYTRATHMMDDRSHTTRERWRHAKPHNIVYKVYRQKRVLCGPRGIMIIIIIILFQLK